MKIRKPKDRDFIKTREDMFFCVTGYLHPKNKYTAYLKYTPAKDGEWRGKGVSYKRKLTHYHAVEVKKTIDFLKNNYPLYVSKCPVRNMFFSFVPKERIKKYYKPEEKLKKLLNRRKIDTLERKTVSLVKEISDLSGVEINNFGVTGSILLGIHNPKFSDIDLIVYGSRNSFRVKEVLKEILECKEAQLKPLTEEKLMEWVEKRMSLFQTLGYKELYRIGKGRWNYGFYQNTYFSIHPVRKDEEIKEKYGDKLYLPIKQVILKATVEDSSEAVFLPSIYKISEVSLFNGNLQPGKIKEVVSYEGLFMDIAGKGDRIEVKGELEKVTQVKGNEEYFRVVIGSSAFRGDEYIKGIEE